jgi:hypothetical protein
MHADRAQCCSQRSRKKAAAASIRQTTYHIRYVIDNRRAGSDEQGLDDDDQQPNLQKADGSLMFVHAHGQQFTLPPHKQFMAQVMIDGNYFRIGPFNSQEEAQRVALCPGWLFQSRRR